MDSSVPANNMGSDNIAKFDPLLLKKPVKRLRDIIGPPKKEKNHGV